MVNEGRATYVICLFLRKAFNTVQHNLFISKLERCGSDRGTTQWKRNWLKVALKGLWSVTQGLSGEQ